jgi:ADP-ribose pyrophosphatase
MVVALTGEQKVVLVRQYRYPNEEFAYELPGGGGAAGDPLEKAREELREETGYRASRLRKLGDFVVYCGLSNEVCSVVLAQGLQRGEQRLEKTEHISVHEVSYEELKQMIRRREFRDGMGLAALNIAREEIEKELAL